MKLKDILQSLVPPLSENRLKPKKMTFDLSEDGTFYYTKLYFDVVDRNTNEIREMYIECKSSVAYALDFVNDFTVRYDFCWPGRKNFYDNNSRGVTI